MALRNIKHIFVKSAKTFKKIQTHVDELKKRKNAEEEVPKEEEQLPTVHVVAISTWSVAKAIMVTLLVLGSAYILSEISHLLLLLFLGLFFAATLDPGVDWLERHHVARSFGVLLMFFVIFAVFVVIIGSMIPIVIEQISDIVANIGKNTVEYFDELQNGGTDIPLVGDHANEMISAALQSLNFDELTQGAVTNLSQFVEYLKSFASGSFTAAGKAVSAGVSAATSVASFFFDLIIVLFFTFFMVVDRQAFRKGFRSLFPSKYGEYISQKMHEVQAKIGAWTRGQLSLSLIMFLLSFIGLLIIGMKYATTLAIVVAVGEFLPYVGPLLFLLFSFPIALNISVFMVVKLLILYGILQFLEGNIIVPLVMEKAVGLSPVAVLTAIIIGFQFLGVIGAIIAVPIATTIGIFVKEYARKVK